MRFEIPDYLYRLKESIPAWMEKLEHPGGIADTDWHWKHTSLTTRSLLPWPIAF